MVDPDHDISPIDSAASAIKAADWVLLAAGAGFSADSGLPVYADVAKEPAYQNSGITYADLCSPNCLIDDPALFYAFWTKCLCQYRGTHCHDGYRILDTWFAKKSHEQVCVYTSNVDGHFRRWPQLRQRLFEIHGCVEEWMCASSIGSYLSAEGQVCAKDSQSSFDHEYWLSHTQSIKQQTQSWQQHHVPLQHAQTSCSDVHLNVPCDFEIEIDQTTMRTKIESGETSEGKMLLALKHGEQKACWHTSPPRCMCCGGVLRPAVLMFGDTDPLLAKKLELAGATYQQWEEEMEKAALMGAKVVVLELGCGLRVPSVRMECEQVVHDIKDAGGDAVLIRINPEMQDDEQMPEGTIFIKDSALSGLERLESAMQNLGVA